MNICCVGCSVSMKAEPKPASVLVDDCSVSITGFATDGESSDLFTVAIALFLMRGCRIISSSSCNDVEPSSMSRSSTAARGDMMFLHIVVSAKQFMVRRAMQQQSNYTLYLGMSEQNEFVWHFGLREDGRLWS